MEHGTQNSHARARRHVVTTHYNEKKGMLWSHVGGYLVSVAIILAGLGVLLKGELKTGPGGTDDVLL